MTRDLLYFNGVNGATGDYDLTPMTGDELARLLRGDVAPEDFFENFRELAARERGWGGGARRGVKEGIDATDLAQAGWGVIFAHDAEPAIQDALGPLLELRREQAGDRFRCYAGEAGFRVGKDSKSRWLAREPRGVGPGPVDPDRVPYYLLIAGSPEEIPYDFQAQLDVQYAVGRVSFDSAEDLARYAESVVAAERGEVELPRKVSLFGVENPGDQATGLSSRHLVEPLAEYLRAGHESWQIDAILKDQATKARLADLLGGQETPALVFTGSHGMGFPNGDARQLPHQGALLCRDWPGPESWKREIPQDFYFAGDDLTAGAKLAGLISFHFACYGAGTPRFDEFHKQAFKRRRAIATRAFPAALPSRMLSHPRGGALAVVGHVERAWGYSFLWAGAGAQTAVFESALDRLLAGHPVGLAVEHFNERHAELAVDLVRALGRLDYGAAVDPYELVGMWTANNDARGYTVLGDPAVRLPVVAPGDRSRKRSALEVRKVESPPSPSPEPSGDAGAAADDLSVESGPEATSFGVAAGDEVTFSAYHPRAIEVGATRRLLIYAHVSAALAAVAADAGQRLGEEAEGYAEAEAEAAVAIRPGTEIVLVPRAEGLVFDPPAARVTWGGSWQRADFRMTATGERAGHVAEGSVGCYVGPLLIADVRLPVVIARSGEETDAADADRQRQSAGMYRAVFASYSHADARIVEAMETACKALGMDYLRDVMELKSGQSWSEELLEMIADADVFQLFWSDPASRSPYVEQEWREALRLADGKGGAFIRPIYWRKPLAPVPAPLSHLHFAPVDVAAWTAPLSLLGAEGDLAARLAGAGVDLGEVTVSTYSAADLSRLPPSGTAANPDRVRLRARTRVSPAGDVDVYLAEGAADEAYLSAHTEAVRAAIEARLGYLELATRGKRR